MKKKLFTLVLTTAILLSGCTLPFGDTAASDTSVSETSVSLDFSYTDSLKNGGVADASANTVTVSTLDADSSDTNSALAHNAALQAEYDLYDPAPGAGYSRSELTNEWITDEAADLRPLAVMIPNNVSSLPQYTLSEAGVLYECNVEGELTRFLAVYDDWKSLERIGCIRSARDYFVYWAMEWDPLFVHMGNIWYADNVLSEPGVDNINGLVNDRYFYRVTSENLNYDQSAYTMGINMVNAAKALGYSTEHTDYYQPGHFSFASKGNPTTLTDVAGNITASYVGLEDAYPIDQPYFIYNPDDGLYYRYEFGMAHTDGVNGKQLAFENIIIQNTYWEYRPDGSYLIYQCHDTTRDGWFITKGTAVHVNWKKIGEFGITKYYDDNGDEIILNQGKTMICIVEDGDPVTIR